jgi:bifunctional non-homologous end joining protein LigD
MSSESLSLGSRWVISHSDLMVANSVKSPFTEDGWLFELKYDGFRILVLKQGDAVRLLTRNGNELANRFPEIVEDALTLKGDVAIDGELVVADEDRHPSFYHVRRRAVMKSLRSVQKASNEYPAQVMAFDILGFNERDVRKEPLLERKRILREALGQKKRRLTFVDFVEREGEVLFEVTNQLGLEGVMAKRCYSIYRAGKTADWLKIKTAVGKEREAKRFEER